MDNLNDAAKKTLCIPMLPSLGKKYSNFEAYLHSRISKNHYLYNEKLINPTTPNTNSNTLDESHLDGIIQCKTLIDYNNHQHTLESNSKFSINTNRESTIVITPDHISNSNIDANSSGLPVENLISNSRHTINNNNKNISRNNKKQTEINNEHEEKSNSIKSNSINNKNNNNKCSNNCKPLTSNNISLELEITTTTKHIRNYNNYGNISNNKLNHSSSSCNALNTDLTNTTISHNLNNNMNTTNNKNSESKHEFRNLINNYSIEFDLPSNMLILSGKNYLNNCQINPNKNATTNSTGKSNQTNNKCQNMLEGASKNDALATSLSDVAAAASAVQISDDEYEDDDATEQEEQDKYLKNNKLEEVNKNNNKNISKIPSEFSRSVNNNSNNNNNLDNRKIILDLKNALRSYCFKYSKKQKSLENFNQKIRTFNRIQMTKRRNELKSNSNREKLVQTNFRKQSITGANTPLSSHSITKLDRRLSFDKLTNTLSRDDEIEEVEEEIPDSVNADEEEDEIEEAEEKEEDYNDNEQIYYFENELADDVEEIVNQLNASQDDLDDLSYEEQLIENTNSFIKINDNLKKEPKVSKINIEFFNRFKKSKNNSKSSKKQHKQQLTNNSTPKQQQQKQLVMNEETDATTLASKIKLKTNLDCEQSLDTFAIINSTTNNANTNNNKPKSKKNKNRKEENTSSTTATTISAAINETSKDELTKLKSKNNATKTKKNINKTKTKELLVATQTQTTARTTTSSSSSFSTSAKSENNTLLLLNNNQKQLNEEEINFNQHQNDLNTNQLELDEEILKIEENELNLNYNNNNKSNNNNKINETNSRNSSIRNKLESKNQNSFSSVEKKKFACTPPQTTITTTIPQNVEQQSNELNNSLNNKNYNLNNSNSNYNNNNIKHVFEKTSLLVKNLYKNFDLLKETQDLSEQIVSSKMYSTTTTTSSSTTTTAASTNTATASTQASTVQQKLTKQISKNTLLTNSTSNLLINTAVGLNNNQQVSSTSHLPASIQQPHWVNLATMNTNSKSTNNKFISNDTQSAIYLYSEMPLINSKQTRSHRNKKHNKLFHFRNGMNIEDNLTLSPIRTTGEARLVKLASMPTQQSTASSNNKQIIFLKRDKAGKLIPIEATTTTSFKQHQQQSLRNAEEAYLTENLCQDSLVEMTSSNLNLNDYLKLPNLMKTKLSFEQLNKQASSNNRDSNYVLAQMTKYQRQNAINFLKLTNKSINEQITSRSSLSGILNNTNMMNCNKSPDLKQTSSSSPPPILPNTAPVNLNNSHHHTPILVRGNSFVAAKDLSNQILTQQTQLNSLTQQQQQQQQQNSLIKPKLSQIKFKSKNRPILISSISDFNLVNNNANLTSLTATLLPSTLELVSATTASNTSNEESINDTIDNQTNADESSVKEEPESTDLKPSELKQNESTELKEAKNDHTNEEAITLPQINDQNQHQQTKQPVINKKFNLMDIEPTLNKCRGLYTYAATSSSQLKDAAFFSNNMKNTRSSVNYSNYNTEAFLSNSTEDILASLLMTQQQQQHQFKNNKNGSTEILTPIKVKNTSNNRQIFKDLEFIYNEQQVIKLQRQILIQIRQQNKLKQRMNQQQDIQDDDEEDEENADETNRTSYKHLDQLNYRNLNTNYNYDYDVYKFYERNKTSLLLNSLQQQSKLKSNSSNNNQTKNKSITKSTVNLNDQDDLDEENEEIETEIRDDDNEELVDTNDSNRNLLSKRVKCES